MGRGAGRLPPTGAEEPDTLRAHAQAPGQHKALVSSGVCAEHRGLPAGSVVRSAPANTERAGLIPGSGRAPGEGSHNPI